VGLPPPPPTSGLRSWPAFQVGWFAGRQMLGRSARLLPLLTKGPRTRPDLMVGPETEICIEGFPRSGNTFAVYAFELWNPGRRVAHHLHAPAQFVRALRLSVPCVALIREPSPAVSSLVAFHEGVLPVGLGLRSYISFHRALLSVVDQVAICRFEELVDDPPIVVERTNERFGTRFRASELDETARRKLRERVERDHRRAGLPESRLTVPTDERAADKRRIKHDVESHRLHRQARAVYDEVVARAAEYASSRLRSRSWGVNRRQ
jgi:hypothetical protein